MNKETEPRFHVYKSPIGDIRIQVKDGKILVIEFREVDDPLDAFATKADEQTFLKCCLQLDEYFSGKRMNFTVPLQANGTDFQKSVWHELSKIPFGKTVSYMDIARRLHNPGSIRAVGSANGKNPISIIIPCHRVIGSDGSLTGYGGGLWRKKWLLDHENKVANGLQSLF
ncbi:MAG: methylated-DNA--[protein]-cysteine S-methyltransferase [Chitinophagaceae bacterium]|nr:methylated-DNA--[protein]-cysteine S-methyltransferase [Chitinophagaceae bacterium]MCW5913092.1 methylated-DNA--[protein]-cysteine S-methyltransferase [Chitinophagaceae bacterium]MCZ2396889.1 methylated-DNA--[protein]-cysteine S-methyltransferase [Chitinophagales bacterium]